MTQNGLIETVSINATRNYVMLSLTFFIEMLRVIMLSIKIFIVMVNVIMLNVVAPKVTVPSAAYFYSLLCVVVLSVIF
jgi:hypothetical protein